MYNFKSGFIHKIVVVILTPAFLFTTFSWSGSVSKAGAQDCESAVSEAEQKYNTGHFDETIEMLEKCFREKQWLRLQSV